ncbi:hypothetical protein [Planotetraspora kaengkrachanensis]|uniref:DUF4386 family protein n=1 Tax=Planotetraspora kaengkrachanensis TaxID=575193 RepID=A0A8J3PZ89_9ACTN|nr:hypothetical protein [Planotetraspora kaengkrachanensis]GIG83814.1 hypothetical protein Pka01_69410 [Planotetraspora kaengkrachanensis]
MSKPTLPQIALVAAPVIALVAEFIEPRDEPADAAAELALIAGKSTPYLIADLLSYVAFALFAVGVIGLVGMVRERGRLAARIGGTMTVIGALAMLSHSMVLLATRDIALIGDPAAMAPANEAMSDGLAATLQLFMLLFGFDLGLTVLVVALWRARLLPGWLAPAGFLALVADFSPTSYNAVIMYVVLIVVFGVLAARSRRAPLASPVPQPVG